MYLLNINIIIPAKNVFLKLFLNNNIDLNIKMIDCLSKKE